LASTFSARARCAQTDHTRFDSVGVPAFQFVQERYEYNSRTHHSNMDVLDRVQPTTSSRSRRSSRRSSGTPRIATLCCPEK
jgi:hypothetical protein